jgi:hypothetical protein
MFRRVVLRQDGNLFLEKTLLVLVSRQQLSSTLGREPGEETQMMAEQCVQHEPASHRSISMIEILKY